MKQVEVTILGQSYILGCPDGGESALLEAVNDVDREMSAIRDGGKVKARERIAVLAALNLAFALAERGEAVVQAGHLLPAVALDGIDARRGHAVAGAQLDGDGRQVAGEVPGVVPAPAHLLRRLRSEDVAGCPTVESSDRVGDRPARVHVGVHRA